MSDAVTPRVIVETTLYRTRSMNTVDHVAYDAVTPGGTVDDGPGYEREVIGYVEVPPHTHIGRTDDWDNLMFRLADVATYLHPKDAAPEADPDV